MPTVTVYIPDAELTSFLRAAKRAKKRGVGVWLVQLGHDVIEGRLVPAPGSIRNDRTA